MSSPLRRDVLKPCFTRPGCASRAKTGLARSGRLGLLLRVLGVLLGNGKIPLVSFLGRQVGSGVSLAYQIRSPLSKNPELGRHSLSEAGSLTRVRSDKMAAQLVGSWPKSEQICRGLSQSIQEREPSLPCLGSGEEKGHLAGKQDEDQDEDDVVAGNKTRRRDVPG